MPQQPDAAPGAGPQNAESGGALAIKLAIELGPLLVFFAANAAAENNAVGPAARNARRVSTRFLS